MRILCAAAMAAFLTAGAAWADQAPQAQTCPAVAAEVDAEHIQRTMETVFEQALTADDDAAAGRLEAALDQRHAQAAADLEH